MFALEIENNKLFKKKKVMKQINNNENQKLYIITRRDLPTAGSQAAQLVHAITQFNKYNPQAYSKWFNDSNYLALLSVKDLEELNSLCKKLREASKEFYSFYEPDYDNKLTAIVINPGEDDKKFISQLPLALKEYSKREEVSYE